MDPILYSSAHGGRFNFDRQEVIANNLANVNTPGFRADLYQSQSMHVQGRDANSLGQSFTVRAANGVNLTTGDLMTTGRNLDVALEEKGWLAVRDSLGKEGYTKGGSLQMDANGRLTTTSGKSVLGNGGPISIPPAQSVNIGPDGTISIVPRGGDMNTPMVIDRIKMVSLDKDKIIKNADGLFQLKNGGKAPADNTLKLRSGVLEGSNVNAIEQMVEMISAGRNFESQMDLLTTVNENSRKLSQLLHE